MTTYRHLLIWFRLLKNCAARQHTAKAVLAVGLRQEALLQRFLIATTANRVFP
jgi:hypothetical protein